MADAIVREPWRDYQMQSIEISVRGVPRMVPCVEVDERVIIASGKWPKMAEIRDEEWLEGDIASSAIDLVQTLRRDRRLKADIFSFAQKVTDPVPRLPYFHRLDSMAVIPIISYSDWFTNRISKQIRSDLSRAAKRGVIVREVEFTDEFVQGIVGIYNETPIRQGRQFWHYGKQFDAVKQMNITYLERSIFLGAYLGDELIGFVKMVHADGVAGLMQIISKEAHQDKRTTNALIAKAVEVCELKGFSHLTYANFRYAQGSDGLTDFKRRNGFEELLVPRYYVPLSLRGKFILSLHLEKGAKALLPSSVLKSLKRVRASLYRFSNTSAIQAKNESA